jgi:hypothetical protein
MAASGASHLRADQGGGPGREAMGRGGPTADGAGEAASHKGNAPARPTETGEKPREHEAGAGSLLSGQKLIHLRYEIRLVDEIK